MSLSQDVYDTMDAISLATGQLHARVHDYAKAGDFEAVAYCQQMRRQLWDLSDAIQADAKANGILGGGA